MSAVTSPTELTTSATDAVLAVECVVIATRLWRDATVNRRRVLLWCWIFGLLSFSSLLGAIVHGFTMENWIRQALWKPLYLSLGVLISLFVVGAVHDWRGQTVAGHLVPWAIGAGVAFYGLTEFASGAFIIFVAYEAAVMLSALTIYLFLAARRQLRGAWIIVLGIVLNLAAAGIQASRLSIQTPLPLDHNGLFHVVQMVALATLALGVRRGMDQSQLNREPV